MTKRRIGTHEEWRAARDELLAEEKELTHRNDELARKRRQLPWVPDEKEYRLAPSATVKVVALEWALVVTLDLQTTKPLSPATR
jgi:predicted dithiol-disulfide oxidoreductase (DUF899 family)